MDIQAATKYYIAKKPVQHRFFGLIYIVDLYPNKLNSVSVKLPSGTVIDCELTFLEEPGKT